MKKYSGIYHTGEDKNYGFRYNYEKALLEYVSLWDFAYDEKEKQYVDVVLSDWQVVDSTGLSKENWEENPEYWVEQYDSELTEECQYLIQEFL